MSRGVEQLPRVEVERAPGTESGFLDADAFCERVARSGLFASDVPIAVTRAPGRLDILGGIADYSGSLVLTLPLAAAALAATQLYPDGRVVAVSGDRRVTLDVDELLDAPFETLARRFAGRDAWAAYVVGPIALLVRVEQAALPGLRLLISSDVPEGKGMGSSAAVEVAALYALTASLGCPLEPSRLALLGQRAEQLLAGAPCGAMDQMTATFGERGRLLELLCRPGRDRGLDPAPTIARRVGDRLWRAPCRRRRQLQARAMRRFYGEGTAGCRDKYLAELDPSRVKVERLPEQLTGEEFLRLYEQVDDPVSVVEPDVVYPVRAATLYPIEEQVRVRRFAELLAAPITASHARLLGTLMYASHASYTRCGLGTPCTDALVARVRPAGWEQGLVGARISGGGCGGTVVVLGRDDAEPLVREITDELGAELMGGSSSGAASFGVRTLTSRRTSR